MLPWLPWLRYPTQFDTHGIGRPDSEVLPSLLSVDRTLVSGRSAQGNTAVGCDDGLMTGRRRTIMEIVRLGLATASYVKRERVRSRCKADA